MTSERPPLLIRPIRPEEGPAWDEMVATSPQGTLFSTTAWKAALESSYGTDSFLLLGCFDQGRLVGGCTALVRRRLGIGMAAMALQTPYGGYLLPPPSGARISDRTSRESAILSALADEMGRRFGLETLICSPGLTDPRPLVRAGYSVTPRFTYLIDLRLSGDKLWERLDGHVRRQVKKAERLELAPCALDAEQGFALFRQTFERRGQPCPVPRTLFDFLVAGEQLQPFRQVLAVSRAGRLASFVIALRFGGTLSYAVASTDPDSMATGVSSLLIWQLLRAHASQAGDCHTFDFVGANIPSIATFKEGFNPSLVPHWRLDRSRGTAGTVLSLAKQLRVGR